MIILRVKKVEQKYRYNPLGGGWPKCHVRKYSEIERLAVLSMFLSGGNNTVPYIIERTGIKFNQVHAIINKHISGFYAKENKIKSLSRGDCQENWTEAKAG